MPADHEHYQDNAHRLRGPHGNGFPAPLRLRVDPGVTEFAVPGLEALVGRHSEADVRLPVPEVSRRHCRLAFQGGEWHVHDLGSLNGISVNGIPVTSAILHVGDRLRVGPIHLLVVSAPSPRPRRKAADTDHALLKQIVDRIVPGL